MKKNNLKIYNGKTVKRKFKINKQNIKKFCLLTLDSHPVHLNINHAKEKGFKNILVQGLFISSLSIGQITDKLIGSKTLIIAQNFNYHKPIYINEEFLISTKIIEINVKFKIALVEVRVLVLKKLHASGKISVKMQS